MTKPQTILIRLDSDIDRDKLKEEAEKFGLSLTAYICSILRNRHKIKTKKKEILAFE